MVPDLQKERHSETITPHKHNNLAQSMPLARQTTAATSLPLPIRNGGLCLLLWLLLATTQTLSAQGQPVDLLEPSQQWQTIFNALAAPPRIEAEFAERRFFPFRRYPRRLEGQMIFDATKGLALRYTVPSNYTVFVQPETIHIQHGETAEPDAVPQGAASAAALKIIPRLMAFAPQQLAEDFVARGTIETDGTWMLSLKPEVIGSIPGMQEIRMEGSGGVLHRLVLVRAANERSEIEIRSVRFPAADEPSALSWPAHASE